MGPGRRCRRGFELDAAEGICADHRLAAGDLLEAAGRAGRQVGADRRARPGRRGPVPAAGNPARVRQECLQESGEVHRVAAAPDRAMGSWPWQADTGWPARTPRTWVARLYREHANVWVAQDFCQAQPGEARPGCASATARRSFTTSTGGTSARAGTGSARRWPGPASRPSWRFGAAARQSPGYRERRPRRRAYRCWQGTSLARQLDDPATRAFAAYCAAYSARSAVTCSKPSPTTGRTVGRPCPRAAVDVLAQRVCRETWPTPPGR